jgi:hypothetical protein
LHEPIFKITFMNIKTFIVVKCLLLSTLAEGRLKHYISYNGLAYTNFFNKETDLSFSQTFLFPCINYKIMKGKIGVEIFYNWNYSSYYKFGGNNIPSYKSIMNIYSTNIGTNFQYLLIENRHLRIFPSLGVVRNWYEAQILEGISLTQDGVWWESFVSGQKESKLGLVGGVNINVPIYKKFYANTNIRYSYFPTAKYNKQNFMWEVGIGYMLQ